MKHQLKGISPDQLSFQNSFSGNNRLHLVVDLTSKKPQKSKERKHVPVLGFVLVAANSLPEAGRPARKGKK